MGADARKSTARKSTVNDAVLAVVLGRQGYGYDLGTRFERYYGGLFRSQVQHIYKCLDRLEEQGKVESIDVVPAVPEGRRPSNRQPKCIYRGTPKGADANLTWLLGQIPSDEARRELWIRMCSVRAGDFAMMLQLLDRYEQAVLASIAFVIDPGRGSLLDEIAQEDHETTIEAQLRWIESAREKIHHQIALRAGLR
jgi:DNA-binding PadR family transcriptional regulator